MKKIIYCIAGLCLCVLILFDVISVCAKDGDSESAFIVVSLGDSYSAGEGIQPYYDQYIESDYKFKSEDWIAHRSTLAWPGLLNIDGVQLNKVKASNLNVADDLHSAAVMKAPGINGTWYFAAVSGAVCDNICDISKASSTSNTENHQEKTVYQRLNSNNVYEKTYRLNYQIEAITSLPNPSEVDYVTLTIGGNDIGFADIMTSAVTSPSKYIDLSLQGFKNNITENMDNLWNNTDGISLAEKLEKTYESILEAAPEATLIVAGYPRLLHIEYDDDGASGTVGGSLICYEEARLINNAVNTFDDAISKIIEKKKLQGYNIEFVDVRDAFDGKEAYSGDDAYIYGLVSGNVENVDTSGTNNFISSASFHPNEKGAQAYAAAVQDKIDSLMEEEQLQEIEPEADINGIFAAKLEELVAQYGVFDVEQNGSVVYTYESGWFNPKGIMSATIYDFDLDGQDEMLLCVSEEYPDNEGTYHIVMYAWEVEDGAALLADSMELEANFTEANDAEEVLIVNLLSIDDRCYLLCEKREHSYIFSDGSTSQDYWIMEYTGDEIQYVCSFEQTGDGFNIFEYTGYEYNNGTVVNSQLYYGENFYEGIYSDALYSDLRDALVAFFGKYGISISDSVEMYDWHDNGYVEFRKDSIFEPDFSYGNNAELIFSFTNIVEEWGSSGVYMKANFKATLSSGSNLLDDYAQDELVSEADDSWKEIYIDYINELRKEDNESHGSITISDRSYALFYADDNDVPELYISCIGMAEGDRLCTIGKDNTVVERFMCRCGGSQYIERSGLICDFMGNMGIFYLTFYILEDGEFIKRDDVYGEYLYDWDLEGNTTENYVWLDEEVTEKEFYDNWNSIMSQSELRNTYENACTADEIIAQIQGM